MENIATLTKLKDAAAPIQSTIGKTALAKKKEVSPADTHLTNILKLRNGLRDTYKIDLENFGKYYTSTLSRVILTILEGLFVLPLVADMYHSYKYKGTLFPNQPESLVVTHAIKQSKEGLGIIEPTTPKKRV
jgi:hypothetical protein